MSTTHVIYPDYDDWLTVVSLLSNNQYDSADSIPFSSIFDDDEGIIGVTSNCCYYQHGPATFTTSDDDRHFRRDARLFAIDCVTSEEDCSSLSDNGEPVNGNHTKSSNRAIYQNFPSTIKDSVDPTDKYSNKRKFIHISCDTNAIQSLPSPYLSLPNSTGSIIPSIIDRTQDTIFSQKIVADIMSIVNKGDPTALKALLLTHCDPTVEFILQYKNGSEPCPYSKSTMTEIHGVQAIALFCETLLVAIPDIRITIQETHCRTLANNGCIVSTCRYAFSGTKTLSMVSDDQNTLITSLPNDHHTDFIRAYYHHKKSSTIASSTSKLYDNNVFYEGRLINGTNINIQKLILFGRFQLTINPITKMINKLLITHSHKRR